MSYFDRATVTVTLNEDEPEESRRNRVVLRRWTASKRRAVTSVAMAPIDMIAAQGGTPQVLIDMPALRLETVKACVESWTGPDFDGRPVTPENVADLPPDIVDTLADACDQLNQGLSADLKNGSGTPTSKRS